MSPVSAGPQHLLRGETHPVPCHDAPVTEERGTAAQDPEHGASAIHARTVVESGGQERKRRPGRAVSHRDPPAVLDQERDVLQPAGSSGRQPCSRAAVHQGKRSCRWRNSFWTSHRQSVVGVSFI